MSRRLCDPWSKCCQYGISSSGACQWCGGVAEPTYTRDALWREVDAVLCDWNRPSQLESHDLIANVGKVYRFIKKREGTR